GTGPAGLSAARWCLARGAASVRVVALDRTASALEHLAALAREAPPAKGTIAVETHVADLRGPWERAGEAPFDLALVSFALNEEFPGEGDGAVVEFLRRVASCLRPEGLLVVVEPALRDASLRLLRVAAEALETSSGALHAFG